MLVQEWQLVRLVFVNVPAMCLAVALQVLDWRLLSRVMSIIWLSIGPQGVLDQDNRTSPSLSHHLASTVDGIFNPIRLHPIHLP